MTKVASVAAVVALASVGTAYGADTSVLDDGDQLSGITDRIGAILNNSGGILLALAGGGIAVYGVVMGNMRLVTGGIIGGIASGFIVEVATSLHGAVI